MTTGAKLLAAILADPTDDTPRFLYADWLDENDQPERAEFIRVQIELAEREHTRIAGEGATAWHRETQRLRRREEELLRDYAALWFGTPLLALGLNWHNLRRGFIAEVTCTAADWLAHGPAVVAMQPVERVRLTAWTVPEFRDVPIPLIPCPDSSLAWELEVRQGRLYSVDEHGAVEVEVMRGAVFRAR